MNRRRWHTAVPKHPLSAWPSETGILWSGGAGMLSPEPQSTCGHHILGVCPLNTRSESSCEISSPPTIRSERWYQHLGITQGPLRLQVAHLGPADQLTEQVGSLDATLARTRYANYLAGPLIHCALIALQERGAPRRVSSSLVSTSIFCALPHRRHKDCHPSASRRVGPLIPMAVASASAFVNMLTSRRVLCDG